MFSINIFERLSLSSYTLRSSALSTFPWQQGLHEERNMAGCTCQF